MNKKAGLPFLLAISMAIGVWLGSGLQSPFAKDGRSEARQKMDQIMRYVEEDYVDTISRENLEDELIAYLLQRLDPHSYYISQDDLAAMQEPLEGGFEGIGVSFNLRNDTIYVINTIKDGPSDKAGLLPGDQIVGVNGHTIAGTGLDNKTVMALLKGPSGSEVQVQVKRPQQTAWLSFDLTRGSIAIHSIDAAYMYDDTTAYVKLARFAKTTYQEFQDRVYPLREKGATSIIIDLRSNGGGVLDAAIDLADEFLEKGKLITYIEGKNRPRKDYFATEKGRFENTKLSVIIDQFSASASEVFAGAIQDQKRGTIIGRKSYGKGLVQEENEWSDGSATRLTVARYYTPNGRNIQREYESIASTSFSQNDSIEKGGIVPDFEMERDTVGVTWLYAEIVHRGLLNDFVYAYRDKHFNELKNLDADAFIANVSIDTIGVDFKQYVQENDVFIDESEWQISHDRMLTRVKAILARSLFDDEVYYRIYNTMDPYVMKAVER
ncbi:MAG: S41 family peptidase [Salibacteraceae bacterium]|nr:S41 family peptidase [Salibacteraceae bacterium]